MKAETYLRQIELLDRQINEDLADLQGAREAMRNPQAVDYSKDKVQTSPEDAMSKRLAQIADQNQQINEEIDKYAGMKTKIVQQMRNLGDTDRERRMQHLLFHKYVLYESVHYIAESVLKITYKACSQLHRDALKEFEEKYADDMPRYL